MDIEWVESQVADTQGNVVKRRIPRWMIAAISVTVIVVLLGAYAFLTYPGVFRPSEVAVTGTVAASGVNPEKITFTNTGCGTENVATISSTGGGSGTYSISLDNGYSYNVSVAWAGGEAALDVLVLDADEGSIVRDWTVP